MGTWVRRALRLCSSAATYGDGARGYSDTDDLMPCLRPLNMYGYSKHLFDLWALRHGLFDRIVGLKYFNVFGPYEDHKGDMRSLVAQGLRTNPRARLDRNSSSLTGPNTLMENKSVISSMCATPWMSHCISPNTARRAVSSIVAPDWHGHGSTWHARFFRRWDVRQTFALSTCRLP